ncbi:YbaK/EbsC family protein [Brucella pseudogrignonensis]|uniref:YbaK/EbsC family protein n=1 Tax=Brucella pseudogrignonensis TaxID=419475 RepID=UPI001E597BE0|nr:YbaK/EbsC family protein [Brucella pseudogrignonensis]MCD4512090.1 YbaK/EbsC family protein [Brucella pseudogrignonensis]
MSLATVKAFFAAQAPDIEVIEAASSTATVAEAAAVHGVAPAQIAKTLSMRVGGRIILLVTAGHARLDNGKAKAAFGGKVKMLGLDEVEALTGHPVGGVCPFGLTEPLPVYYDTSLRAFPIVIPAAGAANAAVKIAPARMAELVDAEWVDVCQSVS